MESAEILSQAREADNAPQGWIILPLSRRNVSLGIAGWVLGIIVGLGLFAFMASVMIPHNYQAGIAAAFASTIILGAVLFVGLGSIWALITDIWRLRNADRHVIVITPEDFVKQEGEKVVHVPLMYVRNITARGTPPPERSAPKTPARQMSSPMQNIGSILMGRYASSGGTRRKRMRTPTTLAFVDSRTDNEVIVVVDKSYGDPFMIAALLKQYAASVQQIA